MMEEPKIALYQEWPERDLTRHGVFDTTKKTKCISIFPATTDGLERAIETAERPDAVLVKLTKDYFSAETLLQAVLEKIQKNKYVDVFKPAMLMPRK